MRSYWRDYILRPQQYLCAIAAHKWGPWAPLRNSTVYQNHDWRQCLRCGYALYRRRGGGPTEHGAYSGPFWYEKWLARACTWGLHTYGPWVRGVGLWEGHEAANCVRCGEHTQRRIF